MFFKWNDNSDKDGTQDSAQGEEVIDYLAEDLQTNIDVPQVDEVVNADAEIMPEQIDMSELTIDEGLNAQDDDNDHDDTAEQVEIDEIDASDETQDENEDYTDITENDETEHLKDEMTELEELFEDEENIDFENTDSATDAENSDSLFDQNDSIDDGQDDSFEDEIFDFADFSSTEVEEDANISGSYDDENEQFANFDAFDNELVSFDGDTGELSVEGSMRHGERGDVEISLSDGEWMQDGSDVSDTDLGSELQLQFNSLSQIDTEDVLFDFNFDDAGTDGSVLGELADLEDDDPTNMLDDLDTGLMIDDELSDVESRF